MTALRLVDTNDSVSSSETSVDKALALLDCFDYIGVSLGVSELARRTGLPKSTAFRLLSILERHGLIERQGTRYALGKRLFELGSRTSLSRQRGLRTLSVPFIVDLREECRETVHLGILDGVDVLYLAKLYGHGQVIAQSAVGHRVPAYCSAVGKALLAASSSSFVDSVIAGGLLRRTGYTITDGNRLREELANIRSAGVAFDREESKIGINCVGAPIVSRTGRLVGAVSACGPVGRFDPDLFQSNVRRTARSIGEIVD
jgi:IclR family transcriptional regulator, KDG regulon repressor